MSRRTQPCRACRGRTRHDDRFCSTCRRNPFRHVGITSIEASKHAAAMAEAIRRVGDQIRRVGDQFRTGFTNTTLRRFEIPPIAPHQIPNLPALTERRTR